MYIFLQADAPQDILQSAVYSFKSSVYNRVYIVDAQQERIKRLKKEEGGHTYRVGIGAARVGRSCLCAR